MNKKTHDAKGIIEKNYDNDIAGNLDRLIHETDLLHQPVTAEEIRLNFPEKIRNTIKAMRIPDLLKKVDVMSWLFKLKKEAGNIYSN